MFEDHIERAQAERSEQTAWNRSAVWKHSPPVHEATPDAIEAARRFPRRYWNKRPGFVEGVFRRKDHLWPRHFGVATDPDGVVRVREFNSRGIRGLNRVDAFCFYWDSFDSVTSVAILLRDGRFVGSEGEVLEGAAKHIVNDS
jgi:hypothetical protein